MKQVSIPSISNQPTAGAPGSAKSLLVVSDPEINSILLDHLLTREWTVEYVATNQEAFSIVKERPFDLIITSQATSAKEDIELLRKIRTIRPHTRMIIRTRASTTQDVYQQVVPEAQRKAVRKLTAFVRASVKEAVTVQ